MSEVKDMSKIFASVNELLSKTDLNDVTAEGAGFAELPDGYYLCEVKSTELGESKSSGFPMVTIALQVVENGVNPSKDGGFIEIGGSKNRWIRKYYPFKNEQAVKSFASDMMKFEGEVEGEPLLSKEYFTTGELLQDAIQLLVGLRIYVHLSSGERNGEKTQWINLVSWKRAAKFELPM